MISGRTIIICATAIIIFATALAVWVPCAFSGTGSTTEMRKLKGAQGGYHSTRPWKPESESLLSPSEAPIHQFYMYRVEKESDNYAWENVNSANLAGVLWYLHNEVVIGGKHGRKFQAVRVNRYKATTRATTPLYEQGMNFGVRSAFDFGRCGGPGDCQDYFDKYGYFVGCNYVDHFPTAQWKGKSLYKNAIWYSLPGPCSSKKFSDHTAACAEAEPGGHCPSGHTVGNGTCTYRLEPAGVVYINELENLRAFGAHSYGAFLRNGGEEYNSSTDQGVGMSFWDGKLDPAKNEERVNKLKHLFLSKWPKLKDLPDPPCDFSVKKFFPGGKLPKPHKRGGPTWFQYFR